MRRLLLYFLLPALISSCSLFDGLEGDDPPCESSDPIDERIAAAVPYQDGQMLTFETSDGSNFITTVNKRSFTPQQISDCIDETAIDFEGINVNNSLEVSIIMFGDQTDLSLGVRIKVNGLRQITHPVNLNAAGAVTGSSITRIIADTVLNGQTFRDVVIADYSTLTNPSLRVSYYNLTSGFIGAELLDGKTVYLRE